MDKFNITDYIYYNSEDRLFSKPQDKKFIRDNIYNILITSFMYINPLEGLEYTKHKNLHELTTSWMTGYFKASVESHYDISGAIYLTGGYNNLIKRIKSQLKNPSDKSRGHGYKYISPDADVLYFQGIVHELESAILDVAKVIRKYPKKDKDKNGYDNLVITLMTAIKNHLNMINKVEVK